MVARNHDYLLLFPFFSSVSMQLVSPHPAVGLALVEAITTMATYHVIRTILSTVSLVVRFSSAIYIDSGASCSFCYSHSSYPSGLFTSSDISMVRCWVRCFLTLWSPVFSDMFCNGLFVASCLSQLVLDGRGFVLVVSVAGDCSLSPLLRKILDGEIAIVISTTPRTTNNKQQRRTTTKANYNCHRSA
jgi:hypothetical protein